MELSTLNKQQIMEGAEEGCKSFSHLIQDQEPRTFKQFAEMIKEVYDNKKAEYIIYCLENQEGQLQKNRLRELTIIFKNKENETNIN